MAWKSDFFWNIWNFGYFYIFDINEKNPLEQCHHLKINKMNIKTFWMILSFLIVPKKGIIVVLNWVSKNKKTSLVHFVTQDSNLSQVSQ